MTDLTDRMRTTAAAIRAGQGWEALALPAAADLLIEAADALEALPVPPGEPVEVIPAPLGELMEVIKQEVDRVAAETYGEAWIAPGGPLPGLKRSGTISPRACPRCDSRTTKSVRFVNKRMMLTCPVCGHEWELKT